MRAVKIALSFLAVLGFFAAAGCNTTEGFGKDMQSAGREIKEEAREHR